MTKAKQRKGQNANHRKCKRIEKNLITLITIFRTREIVTRIKFLQDLVDTYVQKTEKEKVKIADLQKQVKILDEMHKKKYNAATETSLQNAKRESRRVINRIVNQLENSLNCMLQKKGAEEQFQETQKKLINDYRIERRGLGENTKMLERKLEVAKNKLKNDGRCEQCIGDSTCNRRAYENIEEQIAETENRFESDWGQLNEIILAERKKTQEIQIEKNNELEWYWDRGAVTQRIDERDLKEEMALEEARMETATKVEEKQNFEQAKVRALKFEKRVAEIKNSQLKINNMSELIETFSTREKNIFALMQHINSLTSKPNFLETHVRENKEEIDKLKRRKQKTIRNA